MNSDIKRFEKYKNLDDEDILELYHKGDETAFEFISSKYKKLVKLKAKDYFIIGADKEDIIQEGMIGFYKAVRDFKNEKNVSFFSFASICVQRQIITAIKTASRQKNIPLNSSTSLDKAINEGEGDTVSYIDLLVSDEKSNPELMVIDKEEISFIESNIESNLSKMECRVLSLYLKGRSYAEIARIINKDEKAIDNALQRVKKKLEKVILERDKCV